MSPLKVTQETSSTGSSFPAGAQQGLLSPADVQQGLLSLLVLYKFPTLKFCHGNRTKWPLVLKHINLVDNHQIIITAKYGSHHWLWRNTI